MTVERSKYNEAVRSAIEKIHYRMQPGELFDAADCLRLIESNTETHTPART